MCISEYLLLDPSAFMSFTRVKDVMKLEGTGFYPSEKATEDTVVVSKPESRKKGTI